MILLLNLLIMTGFSLTDFQTSVSIDGARGLTISCDSNDSTCLNTCEGSSCSIAFPKCRDCMSSQNNSLQIFLVSLGSYFLVDEAEEISSTVLSSFLSTNHLIAWDAKSIFNTSEYNGMFIRRRFDSLCSQDSFSRDPIVLDQLDTNNKFSFYNPKLVVCFYDQLGIKISKLEYHSN